MQRLAGGRVHGDEGLVDFGLRRRRKLDFGFFSSFFEPLQRHFVIFQINAVFFFELGGQVVHDAHVKVFPAEEGVPVGGFNFEQAIVDFKDRNVKCTAAKVIDRDSFAGFFIEAISQRSRCWLVDDAQHFKTSNFTGIFRGLALGVVKVGRNGNNGLGNCLTEVILGGLFHFLQNEGRNLARGVFLTLNLHPGIATGAFNNIVGYHFLVFGDHWVIRTAADQAFDGEKRVFRVGNSLPFGRLPNEALFVGEPNDGRRCARAL